MGYGGLISLYARGILVMYAFSQGPKGQIRVMIVPKSLPREN